MADTNPANTNSGLLPGFKFEDPTPTPTPIPTPPLILTPEPTPIPTPEPEKTELIPTPEATPTPTPEPGVPAVNEQEILNSIFGEGHPYKSIEEVKGLRISERLTKAQQLEIEHVNAQKAIDNYKSRVALMETPQFLSATKYSNFVKEAGMDVDYATYQKLEKFDPNTMEDLDAIVLLDYLKFQDKGRNHDLLKQQYKLGDYAEEVEDPEGNKTKVERAFDKNAVGREAMLAKKELSQFKEKIANFKPEFQDNSAEKQTNRDTWKAAPEKIIPFFKTLALPKYEKKFGDITIKVDTPYEYTKEDQAEILEDIRQRVADYDMPPTQEIVNALYIEANKDFFFKNSERLFALRGDKIIATIDMALKAKYSNYKGLDSIPDRRPPNEKTIRTDGSKTPSELAVEMTSGR